MLFRVGQNINVYAMFVPNKGEKCTTKKKRNNFFFMKLKEKKKRFK